MYYVTICMLHPCQKSLYHCDMVSLVVCRWKHEGDRSVSFVSNSSYLSLSFTQLCTPSPQFSFFHFHLSLPMYMYVYYPSRSPFYSLCLLFSHILDMKRGSIDFVASTRKSCHMHTYTLCKTKNNMKVVHTRGIC